MTRKTRKTPGLDTTFARRSDGGRHKLGWTADTGLCDGCDAHGHRSVLHMAIDGDVPNCPLVALCRSCLARGLEADSKW